MKFEINNALWQVKEISDEEMQYNKGKEGYYTHGFTCYSEDTIYINATSPEKERTLKHELTHVWLYMYGHNQDDKQFNNEDVCEIVASSNNFINKVVNEYMNQSVTVIKKYKSKIKKPELKLSKDIMYNKYQKKTT